MPYSERRFKLPLDNDIVFIFVFATQLNAIEPRGWFKECLSEGGGRSFQIFVAANLKRPR